MIKSQIPPDSERLPTSLEAKTLALCREALGREQISLHDDFFLLGGDSLSLTGFFGTPTAVYLVQAIDATALPDCRAPIWKRQVFWPRWS